MIGPLTILDAAMLGVPLLLASLGWYYGIRRAIVSWPVRLLLSWWSAAPISFLVFRQNDAFQTLSRSLNLPNQLFATALGLVVLVIVFIVVWLGLSRIRKKILRQEDAGSLGGAFLGGTFGALSGVILVTVAFAVPFMQYEARTPDSAQRPVWAQTSMSLPFLKRASEDIRSILLYLLPAPLAAKPPPS